MPDSNLPPNFNVDDLWIEDIFDHQAFIEQSLRSNLDQEFDDAMEYEKIKDKVAVFDEKTRQIVLQ